MGLRDRSKNSRAGIALIYVTVAMTVLMAFVSFGADWGRVEIAKTELQRGADAAARYAATGICDNTYATKAMNSATENQADGAAISLQSADVTLGNWNASTFTAAATPSNAVRVIAQRTGARGNAVPLVFAQILGPNSCDVKATSIATMKTPLPALGFVGITTFTTSGGPHRVDSYDASAGTYSVATSSASCNTATNGTFNFGATTSQYGDLFYGSAYTNGTSSNLHGSRYQETGSTTFAATNYAPYISSNSNGSATGWGGVVLSGSNVTVASGGGITLPAGTYFTQNLTFQTGSALNIQVSAGQKVTIYVQNLTFNGALWINGAAAPFRPSQFEVFFWSSGVFNLNAQTNFYGDCYGPSTNLIVGGSKGLYGRGIFSSINLSGSDGLHYDTSLSTSPYGNGGGFYAGTTGTITTVK